MTLTVRISSEIELGLRERASQAGLDLEHYVADLIARDFAVTRSSNATLSDADWEALLNALGEDVEVAALPSDFSRADLYAEHD